MLKAYSYSFQEHMTNSLSKKSVLESALLYTN